MTARLHGYARYKLDGCRCYTCAFAVSEYRQVQQMRIAAGTWRADTAPVRAHLRSLMAAQMGYKRAAAKAGVSVSTVRAIIYGRPERGTPPPKTTRYDIAQKLLAVQLDLAPNTNIEASGTARRGQSLHALGYTLTELADHIGWTVANFSGMLHDSTAPHRSGVTVRTAQAVGRMYDELPMEQPTGPAADRAREHARGYRWFLPLAWDDETIDDPAARPCVLPPVADSDPDADDLLVQQFAAGFGVKLRWREKLEVVRRMHERPVEELAELLGVGLRSISTMRSMRLPEKQAVAA